MSLEIIRGVQESPAKIILYGLSGAGKSTLAAKLSRPLFMDFEGGLKSIDVAKTPIYQSVDKFYEDLVELYRKAERDFDYIVIDSADWLVRRIIEQAAGIDKKNIDQTLNKSNGGYGNGKQVLENHIRVKLLPMLTALTTKGYGICLIAHADVKELMNADGIDVKQISPKIETNTMETFVEWSDAVYYLKETENGVRKIVVSSDGTALAKNRYGISGEYDLTSTDFNSLLKLNKNKKEDK